ncbi:DUF6291 domain-containing protein [Listeria ivanovii subsp. ivanovii]
MKVLPDAERLLLYDSLCEYSLNGIEPNELPPMANSLFILMKPNIDSSNRRYKASVENGKKGGAPKGNQNAKKQPKNNQTKQPKNKQDYDLDLDYDLDSNFECNNPVGKPQRTRFKPPTLEEVQAYCQERKNCVDPQRFIDYYASNGWKVGRNSMKDWKAAVRSWERKDEERQRNTPKRDISSYIRPEDYDTDEKPW